MSRQSCRNRVAVGARSGFTLIELLVVIVVVSLLAVILLPVGHRGHGRENARKSACQSNLKQIALAFKQYIGDYDERFPLAVVSGVGPGYSTGSTVGWADALQPYLKNTQIYQCPSETNGSVAAPDSAGYTDYYYNLNLNVRRGGRGTPIIGFDEAKLTISAWTILVADGSNGDATYRDCGNGLPPTVPCKKGTGGPATVPVAQQHLEGSNYAFTDGHVKWLKAITAHQSPSIEDNGSQSRATFAP